MDRERGSKKTTRVKVDSWHTIVLSTRQLPVQSSSLCHGKPGKNFVGQNAGNREMRGTLLQLPGKRYVYFTIIVVDRTRNGRLTSHSMVKRIREAARGK